MPEFLEKLTPTFASSLAVGVVFYGFGGVVSTVFPSFTPIIAGVLGFTCAFAIGFVNANQA